MRFLYILLMLLPAVAWAQPKPKPALTWKDVSAWKSIPSFGGTDVSNNGQWFAYVLTPNEGDSELIVRKTADTTQYTYSIGAISSPEVRFSDDSKWVAFRVSAKDKEKKAAAKPGGKPTPDKVFLIDLATNKKTEFERVKTFGFNGEKASHLAVLLTGNASPAAGSEAAKGSDLLLVDLASLKSQNIGNVSEMAFDKKGNWLAMTIDATEKAGNGLQLRNMQTGVTLTMDNDKARYQSLRWTDKSDGLAVLKGVKDDKYKIERFSVLGVKNLTGLPELTTYDPKADSLRFPAGMTISPNRTPYWSDDLTRLFFGIHKLEQVKKEPAKSAATPVAKNKTKDTVKITDADRWAKIKTDTTIRSITDLQKALAKMRTDTANASTLLPLLGGADKPDDSEKPEVTIWHWQDKRLQSRQQVQETQDKNFSYLSVYTPSTKTFVQLADTLLRNLTVTPKQAFALGLEDSNYELETNLDGQRYADVYVVDLKTGQRQKVREKHYAPGFAAMPQPSPDGTKFLYWEGTNFFVYDLATRTSRNLTKTIPTSFVDTEDDHNQKTPPQMPMGWSSDSKYVLLGDGWDIWQVAVDAKAKGPAAVNLTQTGKKNKMRYQSRFVLDPDEEGIDLKQPMYVRIYGERTKKSGIARLDNGKLTSLIWEDATVGSLRKAKKAATYVFARESFTQPRQYFVSASPDLAGAKQMTKNAPMFDKFAWSAGTQLVDYVSAKGDTLQGALFLPAGYEKGRRYPTVVYYYEKLSQTMHNFSNPDFSRTGWSPAMFTSNGYAVFIPDIVYKLNDPGMSAVWCVLPGVQAAIKTGVVDASKMGIHGHSWGGYQTSFLITQTDQFKAAAAGAPLTDMVSMYNLVYWNTGGGNGAIFEGSQGRLVAPWENWDAYHRNSPMYHVKNVKTPLLLLHNDKDGAVDFTQGLEYYNALRRQHKPVVMMQYKGENHGLAKLANRKDYSARMLEFFDYFLKDKPAPDWWQKGVPKLELDDHLQKRAVSSLVKTE